MTKKKATFRPTFTRAVQNGIGGQEVTISGIVIGDPQGLENELPKEFTILWEIPAEHHCESLGRYTDDEKIIANERSSSGWYWHAPLVDGRPFMITVFYCPYCGTKLP